MIIIACREVKRKRGYDLRLQIESIRVGYDNKTIVHDLSLQIPDGKITTIIGSNGCGKSTLLKAITRILKHDQGHVVLDGQDISKMKTKELAKQLAILPQSPESAHGLTVEELVSYGRFPYQKGFGNLSQKDKDMIEWALQVTKTDAFRQQTVDALSGGQRQRVWIAMALAQETDIIFLDEPTTYLDMAHQLEVLELLSKLNEDEGRTIVMVLHDLNQAARFSDYIVALSNGELVKFGTAEEVVVPEVLQKVFNIDAVIGKDLERTNQCALHITYYKQFKGDLHMKKWLLPMFMMVVLVLAACGNKEESAEKSGEGSKEASSAETITYESETGPVEVPANPKRVVVLSSFVGDLLKLDVNVVGVDSWATKNPNFQDDIKDAVVVENTDIEKKFLS